MEGKASVYQVNPVSRITGEGRAGFLRTWRPGFDHKGARGRGGGTAGAAQFVRGNYKSFKGINLTVLERMRLRTSLMNDVYDCIESTEMIE